MDVSSQVMERYQTSSPLQLAKCLGVEVRYKELPDSVMGMYVPQSFGAIVVLNKTKAELRQKFVLAYDLRKHLSIPRNNIILTPREAHDYEVTPACFAIDLLVENGDVENDLFAVIESFLDAGSPTKLTFGVVEAVAKAKSQHLRLTGA